MPTAQQTFLRITVVAIFIGAVALLSIVGVTLWLVEQTRASTDVVNVSRAVRYATINVRSVIQDAESGQRGFLLTQRPGYLEPYELARSSLGTEMRTLHDITDSNLKLKAIADQLDPLVAAKMTELGETIELARNGQHDAALAIVNSDRGKNTMDQIRQAVDDIIEEVERAADLSVVEQRTTMTALRVTTILGAIVIVVVLGGYTLIVLRYTRELRASENRVQALNASLEQRISERTADLARANDEIQRFAYIVTHDLRAPLVNIMGFTSELETSLAAINSYVSEADPTRREAALPAMRAATTTDVPEAINFIRSSTRKMDGLINAILKLSREGRRTLAPVSVDLRRLLETAAESVRHQVVEAGGDISIEGQAPPVISDRIALDQIFGNLLDNAVKYRDRSRPLHIHLRMRRGGRNQAVVEIEDNGRGIAAQDHERVFDLFRRSGAQDQRGEGIGLAHVRTMARNLGGNIMLTSALDKGTTFTLTIASDLRRILQGSTT